MIWNDVGVTLHLVWAQLILDLVVRSIYNLIIHMVNVQTLAFLFVASTFQFPIRVTIGMVKNSYRLNVLRASHLHRWAELPASTILIFKYLVKSIIHNSRDVFWKDFFYFQIIEQCINQLIALIYRDIIG